MNQWCTIWPNVAVTDHENQYNFVFGLTISSKNYCPIYNDHVKHLTFIYQIWNVPQFLDCCILNMYSHLMIYRCCKFPTASTKRIWLLLSVFFILFIIYHSFTCLFMIFKWVLNDTFACQSIYVRPLKTKESKVNVSHTRCLWSYLIYIISLLTV